MASKAKDRQVPPVLHRGAVGGSKASQTDKLVRTLVYEVRNNIRYQKEAIHLARQALDAFASLEEEGGEEKPDPAAKTRKRELHKQTLTERETERKDRSRERNLFMVLTAFVVISPVFFGVLTATFLVLTATYSQPWGYAGSGIGLVLTLVTNHAAPRGIQMLFPLVPPESPARPEET